MALDDLTLLVGLAVSIVAGLGGLAIGVLVYLRDRKSVTARARTDSAQTTALQEAAAASKASANSTETHLAAIADAANKILSDQKATLAKFEARLKAVEDRLPDLAKPDPRVAALEASIKAWQEAAAAARTGLVPLTDGPMALRKAQAEHAAAERAQALKQQELDLQRRRLEMDEARAQSEANWRVWDELLKPALFPEKKKRKQG